jgi:cytochrome c2
MKNQKFSHKTPHLKGKQHQLDPNLDLKQLVHHSTVQYVDRDVDGDVDVYDNPKRQTPDENPIDINVGALSKKLIAKQKGEIKHTRRGMAYEDLRKWFGKGGEGGVGGGGWDRYNSEGERVGKCAREPGEPKPKCLSKEKAAKMSKNEIAAAVRRKRESDPVADRPGKGEKPKMVSNKIDEALLDKLRGRKVIGRTGSGGKIYASAPKKSIVTYGGKTQDEIRQDNKQNQQLRGEAKEETKYCMKCKKMETRDECSYGPEMWDKMTVKGFSEATNNDHEYSMARSQLSTVINAVKRLKKKMAKGEGEIEAWVQSKITKAADYLDSAADYIDSGEHDAIEEQQGPCWTGYKQVGMKKKGKKMVPNCVPEEVDLEEENKPTNPKLWAKWKAKAKAKFDVYPSAYANGWAAKGYKSEGGGWKSVSEETIEDVNGNTFVEIIDLIRPDPLKKVEESIRIPAKTGNIILVTLVWRGKYYMMKLFFPQITKPNRQEVQDQISKVYPGSRVQSFYVSDIKPGEQFLQVEDWQKVNRKDKTDGLSQKAVNAYRRENPGSKLQTAVTEKKPTGKRAARRKSFCSRMSGMKKRLTSAETARDPDSRINKALRRWNCN